MQVTPQQERPLKFIILKTQTARPSLTVPRHQIFGNVLPAAQWISIPGNAQRAAQMNEVTDAYVRQAANASSVLCRKLREATNSVLATNLTRSAEIIN